MAVLRYVASALLVVAALCALFIAGAAALLGSLGITREIDNATPAYQTVFDAAGDKAVVYSRSALATRSPQIVLLGASNVQELHPAWFDEALAPYKAANLAVDGSSAGDFPLLLDLAYEYIPRAPDGSGRSLRRNVFVLGVWYGQFTQVHGHVHAALVSDMEQFGLYRAPAADAVRPAVPARWMPAAIGAVRGLAIEQHFADAVASRLAALAGVLMSGQPLLPSAVAEQAREAAGLGAQPLDVVRASLNAHPTLVPAAFDAITTIARRISARGDSLLLVDMPVPGFHKRGIKAYPIYQQQRAARLAPALGFPGVSYLDLEDALPDAEFVDPIHPTPAGAFSIAGRITAAICGAPGIAAQGNRAWLSWGNNCMH